MDAAAIAPARLPRVTARLFGRSGTVAEVRALLGRPELALLTLVGVGGAGKTRLALAVAEEATADHTDVRWVPLAATHDAALVPAAVAAAVGVTESAGENPVLGIAGALSRGPTLLVLDNFEHVLAAAPLVSELLAACPGLKILATSRIPLDLYGETLYEVPPLAAPDAAGLASATTDEALAAWLDDNPAAALFVSRANAVASDFAITAANAPAIAAICSRLDGLPLAIELAAGRASFFGAAALLARIDSRLTLLVDGPRDRPARQQTLRGALTWSYELLDGQEQAAFRQLAVFEGGFGLDAAEAVIEVGGRSTAVLPLLASLCAKHLIFAEAEDQAGGGDVRFGLLETVREFAHELLRESGDLQAARARHAGHFMIVAETFAAQVVSHEQGRWLARLDAEQANLRAALAWALEQPEPELALNLATWMREWWSIRSRFTEGRDWLRRATARQAEPSTASALANCSAGNLALRQGDFLDSRRYFGLAVQQAEALGDTALASAWQGNLGIICLQTGEYEAAKQAFEARLQMLERATDEPRYSVFRVVANLGAVAHFQGRFDDSLRLLEDALTGCREAGDTVGEAFARLMLALLAYDLGDLATAEAHHQAADALQRAMGDTSGEADSRCFRAMLTFRRGRVPEAAELAAQSLAVHHEIHNREGMASCLSLAAMLVAAPLTKPPGAGASFRSGLGAPPPEERLMLAAGWLAKAERLRAALGQVLIPFLGQAEADAIHALRAALGPRLFEEAWTIGRLQRDEEVATAALSALKALATRRSEDEEAEAPTPAGRTSSLDGLGLPLSAKERQVAERVAAGETNRAIAAALGVTAATVATHIAHIMNKLGLENRTQIAVWIAKQDK